MYLHYFLTGYIIKDFAHKVSTASFEENHGVVAAEELNIKGMVVTKPSALSLDLSLDQVRKVLNA